MPLTRTQALTVSDPDATELTDLANAFEYT